MCFKQVPKNALSVSVFENTILSLVKTVIITSIEGMTITLLRTFSFSSLYTAVLKTSESQYAVT